MNRREFCRNIALIAAGSQLVLSEQIEALARTIEMSSQHIPDGKLVSVHDITFGFDATPCDRACVVTFYDGQDVKFQTALNQRATFRWVAVPSAVILTSVERFRWEAKSEGADVSYALCGGIHWIDEKGMMRFTPIGGDRRHLHGRSISLEVQR